ncbi:unnamed protein product, partial [Polarella glacialis]
VTVSEGPCELYFVYGKDFRKLPEEVFEPQRARMSAETARRLRRCCVAKAMGWEKQKLHFLKHRSDHSKSTGSLVQANSKELQSELWLQTKPPMHPMAAQAAQSKSETRLPSVVKSTSKLLSLQTGPDDC